MEPPRKDPDMPRCPQHPARGALSAQLLELRAAQLDERSIEELAAWDRAAAAAAEARVAASSLEVGADAGMPTGGRPLIITWYLSAASPFCRATLEVWIDAVRNLGCSAGPEATVADAPSPRVLLLPADPPRAAVRTAAELGSALRIEHDDGGWADLFGIRYTAPAAFRELLGLEIDPVPLPATYVLAADGVVLGRFVHPDSRFRAEPATCIAVARG